MDLRVERAAHVVAGVAGSAVEDMTQALGWFGSILVVASLALHRPVAFRVVNLASAVVLLTFNLAIGLWSMVVLNVAILSVNTWHLRKLVRCSAVLEPAPPEKGLFIRARARVDQNAASTR